MQKEYVQDELYRIRIMNIAFSVDIANIYSYSDSSSTK